MYNKREFNKINDKKVMHKVRKHWVVVSLALLGLLGGGALTTHADANADSTTNNNQNNLKDNINQNLQKQNNQASTLVKQQPNNNNQINSTNNNQSNRASTDNIMKQANAIHSNIILGNMNKTGSTNGNNNYNSTPTTTNNGVGTSSNSKSNINTANNFNNTNVSTFTTQESPKYQTVSNSSTDTVVHFHDIYNDFDKFKAPKDMKVKSGQVLPNFKDYAGEFVNDASDASNDSDRPDGWVFVNSQGQIVKNPIASGTNQIIDVAPTFDGMIYKYNKAKNSVEFTGGSLDWNGTNVDLSNFATSDGEADSDPDNLFGAVESSDGTNDPLADGTSTENLASIKIDSDVNTSKPTNAGLFLWDDSSIRHLTLPSNFGQNIKKATGMIGSDLSSDNTVITLNNPSNYTPAVKSELTSLKLYRELAQKDSNGYNYTTNQVNFSKGNPITGDYVFNGNPINKSNNNSSDESNQNNGKTKNSIERAYNSKLNTINSTNSSINNSNQNHYNHDKAIYEKLFSTLPSNNVPNNPIQPNNPSDNRPISSSSNNVPNKPASSSNNKSVSASNNNAISSARKIINNDISKINGYRNQMSNQNSAINNDYNNINSTYNNANNNLNAVNSLANNHIYNFNNMINSANQDTSMAQRYADDNQITITQHNIQSTISSDLQNFPAILSASELNANQSNLNNYIKDWNNLKSQSNISPNDYSSKYNSISSNLQSLVNSTSKIKSNTSASVKNSLYNQFDLNSDETELDKANNKMHYYSSKLGNNSKAKSALSSYSNTLNTANNTFANIDNNRDSLTNSDMFQANNTMNDVQSGLNNISSINQSVPSSAPNININEIKKDIVSDINQVRSKSNLSPVNEANLYDNFANLLSSKVSKSNSSGYRFDQNLSFLSDEKMDKTITVQNDKNNILEQVALSLNMMSLNPIQTSNWMQAYYFWCDTSVANSPALFHKNKIYDSYGHIIKNSDSDYYGVHTNADYIKDINPYQNKKISSDINNGDESAVDSDIAKSITQNIQDINNSVSSDTSSIGLEIQNIGADFNVVFAIGPSKGGSNSNKNNSQNDKHEDNTLKSIDKQYKEGIPLKSILAKHPWDKRRLKNYLNNNGLNSDITNAKYIYSDNDVHSSNIGKILSIMQDENDGKVSSFGSWIKLYIPQINIPGITQIGTNSYGSNGITIHAGDPSLPKLFHTPRPFTPYLTINKNGYTRTIIPQSSINNKYDGDNYLAKAAESDVKSQIDSIVPLVPGARTPELSPDMVPGNNSKLNSKVGPSAVKGYYNKIKDTHEAITEAHSNPTQIEKEDSANHNNGYIELVRKNK